MKKFGSWAALCLVWVLMTSAAAVAQEPPAIDEPPGQAGKGEIAPGILTLEEDSAGVAGSYSLATDTATFQSVEKGDQIVDVTVELHGMTLTATVDFANQTAIFDGYGSATKGATVLREEDSSLIAALSKKIQSDLEQKKPSLASEALVKAVSIWEEWPSELSLSQSIGTEQSAASSFWIYMLCGQARCPVQTPGGLVWSFTGPCAAWNWTYYSEHDCNQCNFGQPRCQQIAQLGDHHRCNGDEFYWTGTSWACGEPNHWVRPYVTGNCYARCGAGCGWFRQYTLNCMDHDACVRNGHSIISWWCADQFIAAIDDQFFAPNCY